MNWKHVLSVTVLITVVALSNGCGTDPSTTLGLGPQCHGDDPNGVEWQSWRDLTTTEFGDKFNELVDDYRMIDVEAYETRSGMRYAGVWRLNTDNRKWAERRDLSDTEYSMWWQTYKAEGMRPIDVEAYQVGGVWNFAGVWVENCEKLGWASFRNISDQEFSDRFTEYSGKGYRPIDIEASPANDATLYSVIWLENDDNTQWIELRDMSESVYTSNFQSFLSQGYRALDVESYIQGGVQRYAAIWVRNTNGRGWAAWRDMSQQGWANKWRELTDRGYRPIDIDVYPTPTGEMQYLGVWRQDGDRNDWADKDAVDNRVQQFMSDYNLVGISAVIIKDGKVVYRRGFGFADAAANKEAWSKTIYRTASVAKSITGIVAMRLVDQDFIDLDLPTRDYVPSLPAFHTHTLRNLLSHRACIRHYIANDPVWNSPGYAYAQDALVLFENDPLQGFNGGAVQVCNAPNQAYSYSTHGFTIFAAACEVAVGNVPYSQILTAEISDPFGISTLKQEDRSDGEYERSEIYDTSGNPIASPFDVTWKLAGGGMEISTYDLARMGMMLIDNQLMPNTLRTEMWTPPDGLSSYALAWGTGTHLGRPVRTHNGAQEGARTVWRLYPNDRLSIAVMTSIQINETSGNSIDDLARDIATIVLQ